MFGKLLKRVTSMGERAAGQAKERIVRELDGTGLELRTSERGVEIRGRGLLRRLLTEERLRWVGRLFR